MNSHFVNGYGKSGSDGAVLGVALYPVLPLLNHSCHANTVRDEGWFHCRLKEHLWWMKRKRNYSGIIP